MNHLPPPPTTDPQASLRALNEAAYSAASALRTAGDPRAAEAKRIALATDDLVENRQEVTHVQP